MVWRIHKTAVKSIKKTRPEILGMEEMFNLFNFYNLYKHRVGHLIFLKMDSPPVFSFYNTCATSAPHRVLHTKSGE